MVFRADAHVSFQERTRFCSLWRCVLLRCSLSLMPLVWRPHNWIFLFYCSGEPAPSSPPACPILIRRLVSLVFLNCYPLLFVQFRHLRERHFWFVEFRQQECCCRLHMLHTTAASNLWNTVRHSPFSVPWSAPQSSNILQNTFIQQLYILQSPQFFVFHCSNILALSSRPPIPCCPPHFISSNVQHRTSSNSSGSVFSSVFHSSHHPVYCPSRISSRVPPSPGVCLPRGRPHSALHRAYPFESQRPDLEPHLLRG